MRLSAPDLTSMGGVLLMQAVDELKALFRSAFSLSGNWASAVSGLPKPAFSGAFRIACGQKPPFRVYSQRRGCNFSGAGAHNCALWLRIVDIFFYLCVLLCVTLRLNDK